MTEDYHKDLEKIADGKLEYLGNNLIYKGKTRILVFTRDDFVLKDEIYKLPISQSDHITSFGRYQNIVNLASEDHVNLIQIADPYGWVNSMKLAEITASGLGMDKLAVIDIAEYLKKYDKPNGKTLWCPEVHESWGGIDQDKTYLLAGFEKLDENILKAIFQSPFFEINFEHFQERKYEWEGKDYKHNLLFLLTGKAEEAFDDECRRIDISSIGSMQNFLGRVFNKLLLYCIEKEPPIRIS